MLANQLFDPRWLSNWQGVSNDRLRPNGFPLSVDGTAAALSVLSIPNPTAAVKTTENATTICRWEGTGDVSLGGYPRDQKRGDHSLQFTWT